MDTDKYFEEVCIKNNTKVKKRIFYWGIIYDGYLQTILYETREEARNVVCTYGPEWKVVKVFLTI